MLDERLRVRARERRRRRWPKTTIRCSCRRSAGSASRWPSTSCGAAKEATKLITIRVTGANTNEDARTTARAIANSPLVKTAVHGGDPNWGRLVAVAGRARALVSIAQRSGSARWSCSATARRSTNAPRGSRVSARQGDRAARRSGNRRAGRIADVVLRPDRGLRADQRGLSDIDPGIEESVRSSEHRWFAAMALSTTDHRTPDYRSTDSRITGLPTTGLPDYRITGERE